MSDLSVLERTILEALRARIHERLSAAEAAGASAADFGDPDEVAETMVAALPVSHPFDAVTGPFYDTPGLVKWLGITRQALHHRVKTSQLLACPTEDGHTVYPAWQFTTEGGTIPHLTGLLRVLNAGATDPWMIALWLRAPSERHGGRDAASWLAAGEDPASVMASAHEAAERWAA